jgi:DUF1680 family protein
MRSNRCYFWGPLLAACSLASVAAEPGGTWPAVSLAAPGEVELGGPVGEALARGVERLGQAPYTADWLLADVSFKVSRIFTNYSGDVSGRFLELASLTSPRGRPAPPSLGPVAAEIAQYQKADGHFGADMDFAKPMPRNSPPIPMLWGNGRLLVGLVTAAGELRDPNLLAAARRLGDFYVSSANVFCSAAREAELRATGTGGDGYTCCYFPAIEGLALLYRATGEGRYLDQARRMAEWFGRFDALPIDHSHGNLCAWRGILLLYQLTGQRSYLERALAKWEAAVRGGFVWTLGGVGEHWYVFHPGDEGCSESDWLRFNLELWRYTGQTRFLDMAERLLLNQYAANQCPNGGYGWRAFDGEAAGPVGTHGPVDEWNFCCSFHGPLGLHFLKAYLAAASERGVFVNFPLDFRATLDGGGRGWRVAVRTLPPARAGWREFEVELAPANETAGARATLWLRRPDWAMEVELAGPEGQRVPFEEEGGYLKVTREFKAGAALKAAFQTALRVEGRRFQAVHLEPEKITRLEDVALLDGADVLFATPAPASGRMTLLGQVGAKGDLGFWQLPGGGWVTAALPDPQAGPGQITAALESARPVTLGPESALRTQRRAAFVHDMVIVPAGQLPAEALRRFVARAPQTLAAAARPCFGEHLEKQAQAWLGGPGWQFTPEGLRVSAGDIGLLEGEGYADYRFEFDMELPRAGRGITGWVVRAADPYNCLHFQIQSADSTINAPEFTTRPNTLRPHARHNGQWTIADPVPLPREVLRGQSHHVAVECRGPSITVFLDGDKVFTGDDAGFRTGTVGFRASGPDEQGLFRNICLRNLQASAR